MDKKNAVRRKVTAVLNKEQRARIDEAVFTDSLQDMLKRADDGDIIAARTAMLALAQCLKRGELPDFGREWLADAFYKIANGKEPANALRLTRPGRPNIARLTKRKAAYLVHREIVEEGKTVDDAVSYVAENINELKGSGELPAGWLEFEGIYLDKSMLQSWYYKHLDELKAIYLSAAQNKTPP